MNLADLNLQPIVAKAIIDTLTPETRAELLETAVKNLLTENITQGSGYNATKTSLLQQTFNFAVRQEAERITREKLASDADFTAKMEALFADVARNLFEGDQREKLVGDIADRIGRAFTGDRY